MARPSNSKKVKKVIKEHSAQVKINKKEEVANGKEGKGPKSNPAKTKSRS